MFGVGFLGVSVTVGRTAYVFTLKNSPVIGLTQSLAALEQAVGLIVVCLPALRALVMKNSPRISVSTFGHISSGNTDQSMLERYDETGT